MNRLAIACVLAIASRAYADSDPAALEASGNKHYELAEYGAAIADFKEAFRLTDRPELLFNIAQAYRLSGDCAQAKTFYKTYLRRVPDAANAEQVRGRIDEQCAVAPAAPPPEQVPVVVPVAAPPTARTWKTRAGLGLGGAGVLGVGVGVVFAARGSSKREQLARVCATDCSGATARGLDDAGHAANRNAAIGFAAGGALLATGVVLFVLDRPRESGPSVSVGGGGAAASWIWTF